ncbi:hypothetical protein AAZV13_20G051900 [Glycine max]
MAPHLNLTQHPSKILTYLELSLNPNFLSVSSKMALLSLMCPYSFYPADHHQLHVTPYLITILLLHASSAKHIRLKGSIKYICDGKPKVEEAETKTNQTKPKNENLKDSKLDGRCNAQSIGILRSTLVIG